MVGGRRQIKIPWKGLKRDDMKFIGRTGFCRQIKIPWKGLKHQRRGDHGDQNDFRMSTDQNSLEGIETYNNSSGRIHRRIRRQIKIPWKGLKQINNFSQVRAPARRQIKIPWKGLKLGVAWRPPSFPFFVDRSKFPGRD